MSLNENIGKLVDIDRKRCHFRLLSKKESFTFIKIIEFLPIHSVDSYGILIDLKKYVKQNLRLSFDECGIFHNKLPECNILILIIIAIVLKQSSEHVLNVPKSTVLRYVTECILMKWKIFNFLLSLSAKDSNFYFIFMRMMAGNLSM